MVGELAEGLFLNAFDVPAVISDDGSVTVGALRPGETGPLLIVLENRGDEPVGALTLSAKLPAGATFDQKVIRSSPEFRGCVFTDFRYAGCDLTGLVLLPASEDPDRAVWARPTATSSWWW